MKLSDGSILSASLSPISVNRSVVQHFAGGATKIFLGQVVEVFYIDHKYNHSKRFVEYNVQISEDASTTSICRNCRALDDFGDPNNFSEKVFQPVTDGKRGKKDEKEVFVYKNGGMVLVAFIGGNRQSAVILGGIQHPRIGGEKRTSEVPEFKPVGSSESRDDRLKKLPTILPGSDASDTHNGGQRVLGEFQGLRWNINKEGELTIIYQGTKNVKGQLNANDTQPTVIKINKDGEVFLIDNLDQEIKISRIEKKIMLSSGNKEPDFIEISREKKDITASCQHQIVTVAPTVSIGGKDAKEPLVLGNVWMAFYNTMIQTQLNPLIAAVKSIQASFNSHSHAYTWEDPKGAGSTAPPTSGDGAGIPANAPNSGAAQYSDFCFTKKKYSKKG